MPMVGSAGYTPDAPRWHRPRRYSCRRSPSTVLNVICTAVPPSRRPWPPGSDRHAVASSSWSSMQSGKQYRLLEVGLRNAGRSYRTGNSQLKCMPDGARPLGSRLGKADMAPPSKIILESRYRRVAGASIADRRSHRIPAGPTAAARGSAFVPQARDDSGNGAAGSAALRPAQAAGAALLDDGAEHHPDCAGSEHGDAGT